MKPLELFAPCPAPLAPLLERELGRLGARDARARGAGVAMRGDLRLAYRACLWSRVASRILLPLARVGAADGNALYAGARSVDWTQHMAPDATFARKMILLK